MILKVTSITERNGLRTSDSFAFFLQIMSLHLRYISFLWQVADLGCNLNMPLLRDGARVLMKLMPPGRYDQPHLFVYLSNFREM